MNQISFFEKLKLQIVFVKDKTDLEKDFVIGAEFELFMETKEHYHIFHKGVFLGTYKDNCRKV